MPHMEVAEEMTEETTDEMSDAFPDDEGATEETASETEEVSVDEENAENPTALLPLSAFGKGAKAGDTITLKVVKLHGDEVEVELSAKTKSEETEKPMSADAELDSMDTGGY